MFFARRPFRRGNATLGRRGLHWLRVQPRRVINQRPGLGHRDKHDSLNGAHERGHDAFIVRPGIDSSERKPDPNPPKAVMNVSTAE